jgi:hypothetical protein
VTRATIGTNCLNRSVSLKTTATATPQRKLRRQLCGCRKGNYRKRVLACFTRLSKSRTSQASWKVYGQTPTIRIRCPRVKQDSIFSDDFCRHHPVKILTGGILSLPTAASYVTSSAPDRSVSHSAASWPRAFSPSSIAWPFSWLSSLALAPSFRHTSFSRCRQVAPFLTEGNADRCNRVSWWLRFSSPASGPCSTWQLSLLSWLALGFSLHHSFVFFVEKSFSVLYWA